MTRTTFNSGWSYRRKATAFQELGGTEGSPWVDVVLPHDALITTERHADAPDGHTNGYFDGGAFEYRRVLDIAEADRGKQFFLEFDGVHRDPVVYVNGALAGRHAFGYSRFVVRIDPFLRWGDSNEIRVASRTHLDSRWYAGAGIHRDVHLIVKTPIRFGIDGIRVTTPEIQSDRATVEVAARVENAGPTTVTSRVSAVLRAPDGAEVARGTSPITLLPSDDGVVRLRLRVASPELWSAEHPDLYSVELSLTDGEAILDLDTVKIGIRSIAVDAERGLRINGESVKLRGACIHGDNGPLGVAAFGRAEERRIELLKAAGFNAIRMSHHPASSALLAACDRIGMYVMDEAFDMWTSGKSDFDYSTDFPEWWERDIDALVAKDANHASVIFYSIGNEIPETGSADGGRWSRRLAERVRQNDPTRLVTNGINGFVSVIDLVLEGKRRRGPETVETAETAGGVNGMMAAMGAMMGQITASPMASERTEESFAVLDVAGMNYGEARYELDRELFPERVIVGTETWPTVIDRNWELVNANTHVIGDFTWTGFDYLGEVGIGVLKYVGDAGGTGFATPYPGLTAWCGDLDITGHRRPASFYREIVFGLRTEPYIAVQRPEHYGEEIAVVTPWSWSDAISSWSWPGFEGEPAVVEVYADADEVELLLDGESLGRAATGTTCTFQAEFEVRYQPGELVAVAYRRGLESGRTLLRSAGDNLQIHLVADRSELGVSGDDLAYVTIELVDAHGTVKNSFDRPVQVTVTGNGVLHAYGTGNPATMERFDSTTRTTFDGRAIAIVRPTGIGQILVAAEAEGCEPVTVRLTAGDGVQSGPDAIAAASAIKAQDAREIQPERAGLDEQG